MSRSRHLRRIAAGVSCIILLGLALQVLPGERSQAAPGDVDLQVSITGTPNAGILNLLASSISWTVRVTNSTDAEAINATATGIVVQDEISGIALNLLIGGRQNPSASSGSYDASTGTWTIASLAPGATATLTFRTQFTLALLNYNAILSAQVTAASPTDRDSTPAENAEIGDEDDEAVYRTGYGTLRTVGDLVWNDFNGNGLYAAGEPGIPGAQVIVESGGTRLFAGHTSAAGAWSYDGLISGSSIVVTFIAPAGYAFTTPKAGADSADSDPVPSSPTNRRASTAARTVSANDPNIDAGLRVSADLAVTKSAAPASGPAPHTATYTVTLTNSGPGAAAGVQLVDTLPAGGQLVAGSISAPGGTSATASGAAVAWNVGLVPASATRALTYQVLHPGPGSFANRAQVTAATSFDPDSTPDAATTCLAGQDDCAAATVSVFAAGLLTGTVWLDHDGNGQRNLESEPGLAGVTVRRLTTAGVTEASIITTAGGSWSFASVPAGSYLVEVVAPAGARFTLEGVPPEATDSDVGTDGRASVAVTAGGTTTVDAGLARADSPAGAMVLVPQGVAGGFNVLNDDAIPGRPAGGALPAGYSWTRIDGPAWGSVTCSQTGDCIYRSIDKHAGPDSFRYSVTNPIFGAATVEVNLEVLHVNDAPVARDDRGVTLQGEPVTVEVTNNDEDPNDPAAPGDPNRPGDPPTVDGTGPVEPPGSGSVECTPAACTYTPASGFTGSAAFSYTVRDLGRSDPRVDDPGVAGGIAAETPLSAVAQVRVWVDPPAQQATGFSAAVEGMTATGAGAWNASIAASVNPGCSAGRPQVSVAWDPVPKATGYRIERRPLDAPAGTDRWVELAQVAGTGFVDDLLGEGQTQRYRVTPLRHRLTGRPSNEQTAAIPSATGPGGC